MELEGHSPLSPPPSAFQGNIERNANRDMLGNESKVSNPSRSNTDLDQDTQKNVLRRRQSESVKSTASSTSIASGSSKQTSEAISNPPDSNIAHIISEGLQKGTKIIIFFYTFHIFFIHFIPRI